VLSLRDSGYGYHG
jgi:hypothetical protein